MLTAIETKFIPATDTRGARISAVYGEGQNKSRITIPYPYNLNGDARHAAAARALLEELRLDFRYVLISDQLPSGNWCHILIPKQDCGSAARMVREGIVERNLDIAEGIA